MLDLLSNRQKSIETDVGEAASEFAPQTGPPETIPGVGPAAAKAMAGKTGADPGEFPPAAQFRPQAGLRPGENESAGKKKRGDEFRPACVKGALRGCARGMIRKKGSHPSKFYWKPRARRGPQKAPASAARKMAGVICRMLEGNAACRGECCEEAKKRGAEPGKGKLFAVAGRLGCTPAPAGNLA
ncbi:MAG: transposase [Clostridiales bacterium]|nr:transposase [Clostridiales bacterium]